MLSLSSVITFFISLTFISFNSANMFDISVQYSNMAPRLSRQMSIFGIWYFFCIQVWELRNKRNLKKKKIAIMSGKLRSPSRVLMY